ncbi:hypothetical protein IAU60_003553 [Kwoniella sp. DSM 27419]
MSQTTLGSGDSIVSDDTLVETYSHRSDSVDQPPPFASSNQPNLLLYSHPGGPLGDFTSVTYGRGSTEQYLPHTEETLRRGLRHHRFKHAEDAAKTASIPPGGDTPTVVPERVMRSDTISAIKSLQDLMRDTSAGGVPVSSALCLGVKRASRTGPSRDMCTGIVSFSFHVMEHPIEREPSQALPQDWTQQRDRHLEIARKVRELADYFESWANNTADTRYGNMPIEDAEAYARSLVADASGIGTIVHRMDQSTLRDLPSCFVRPIFGNWTRPPDEPYNKRGSCQLL